MRILEFIFCDFLLRHIHMHVAQLLLLKVASLSLTFDLLYFLFLFHHRHFPIHPAGCPDKHVLGFSKWIKNVVKTIFFTVYFHSVSFIHYSFT